MNDVQKMLYDLIPMMSQAQHDEQNKNGDKFGTVLWVQNPGTGAAMSAEEINKIFDMVDTKAQFNEVIQKLIDDGFVCSAADAGVKPSGTRPGRP